MLQFFRINDPYRILFVGLLLIIIRLPFIILMNGYITLEELNWTLVGGALNNGGDLYKTLITDIAPLSGLIYQFTDLAFSNHILGLQLLTVLLVLFQAYLFNAVLLRSKVYDENTYVPSVLYVVFMTYHFDTLSLSPGLIGLTFIIMAINNVLQRLDQATGDDLFSTTGIYLAVASLFYFPYVFFLPATLISLMVLSNPKLRRIALMLFSFSIVYAAVFSFFYLTESLQAMQSFFIEANMTLDRLYLVSLELLSEATLPVVFLTILSAASIVFSPAFTNSQKRVFYAILIFSFFGIVAMIFSRRIVPSIFILLAIPSSFFYTQYLLRVRRKWLAESLFVLSIVILVGDGLAPLVFAKIGAQYDNYLITQEYGDSSEKKASLLILGEKAELYTKYRFAGDFLDWPLCEPMFRRVQSIDNLVRIESSISNNQPDVIIDPAGYMDAIFEIIPKVGNSYVRSDVNPNLVISKESYLYDAGDAHLQIQY